MAASPPPSGEVRDRAPAEILPLLRNTNNEIGTKLLGQILEPLGHFCPSIYRVKLCPITRTLIHAE